MSGERERREEPGGGRGGVGGGRGWAVGAGHPK